MNLITQYYYCMKELKVISRCLILSLCFVFCRNKDIYEEKVNLIDEVIVLNASNEKLSLGDVCKKDKTLFFWFSEKCCHVCVEKEFSRLKKSELLYDNDFDIIFVTPKRPIRSWFNEVKKIKDNYQIHSDIYCLYSMYSLTKKEAYPYYFVYDRNNNVAESIFYPDRNSANETYEYFKFIRSAL